MLTPIINLEILGTTFSGVHIGGVEIYETPDYYVFSTSGTSYLGFLNVDQDRACWKEIRDLEKRGGPVEIKTHMIDINKERLVLTLYRSIELVYDEEDGSNWTYIHF